jgi:hypothetical protein
MKLRAMRMDGQAQRYPTQLCHLTIAEVLCGRAKRVGWVEEEERLTQLVRQRDQMRVQDAPLLFIHSHLSLNTLSFSLVS